MKTHSILALAACLIATGVAGKASSEFAAVDSTGNLVRGTAISASHPGDGFYIVEFDHSVKKCVFTATTGSTTTGTPSPGIATVVGSGNDPDGVVVTTYDPSGTAVDYSFYLNVRC